MDPVESKRSILIGFASLFGVEISPEETSLEAGVDALIGFLADIDALDLDGVAPASVYDPVWPHVNAARS